MEPAGALRLGEDADAADAFPFGVERVERVARVARDRRAERRRCPALAATSAIRAGCRCESPGHTASIYPA
jgi:hypothetical protein